MSDSMTVLPVLASWKDAHVLHREKAIKFKLQSVKRSDVKINEQIS